MENNAEERQIKSLKRIIKNLDKEIGNLTIEKNTLINVINILNAKLTNLLAEIEEEKKLSKEFLIFEFDKFFELSKTKMQKINEEKDILLNHRKLGLPCVNDAKTTDLLACFLPICRPIESQPIIPMYSFANFTLSCFYEFFFPVLVF